MSRRETFSNEVMRVYGGFCLKVNFPGGELFLWSNFNCDMGFGAEKKGKDIGDMGKGLGSCEKN
jgi:hypothetical protein